MQRLEMEHTRLAPCSEAKYKPLYTGGVCRVSAGKLLQCEPESASRAAPPNLPERKLQSCSALRRWETGLHLTDDGGEKIYSQVSLLTVVYVQRVQNLIWYFSLFIIGCYFPSKLKR